MALEVVGSTPITHPRKRKSPIRGLFFSLAWVVSEPNPESFRSCLKFKLHNTKLSISREPREGEIDQPPITHPKRKKHPLRGVLFVFCGWVIRERTPSRNLNLQILLCVGREGKNAVRFAMVLFKHQGVLPCSHAVRGESTSHHPHSGAFFFSAAGDKGANPLAQSKLTNFAFCGARGEEHRSLCDGAV